MVNIRLRHHSKTICYFLDFQRNRSQPLAYCLIENNFSIHLHNLLATEETFSSLDSLKFNEIYVKWTHLACIMEACEWCFEFPPDSHCAVKRFYAKRHSVNSSKTSLIISLSSNKFRRLELSAMLGDNVPTGPSHPAH